MSIPNKPIELDATDKILGRFGNIKSIIDENDKEFESDP